LALLSSFRSLFNESQMFWNYVNWVITCTIILPFGLFFYQIADEHLRNFLRWLLAAQTVFAIFGILAASFRVSLAQLSFANNFVVLATLAATALFLVISKWRPGPHQRLSHEFRVFIAAFLVWMLFVVHSNLLGLKILTGQNVEFVGFLVFVAGLGYISAYRTFGNEKRLIAINKELEIARTIQSSTLPQSVPNLAGLQIAARYVPMSAVAGDFYDFLSIDEKRIGILVADVTGHGVPAALIASMLKVAFASQAAHAHDPGRVLTGLNGALCGKFDAHYVTAAYLFVDMEKSSLHYSAAGHPPLMLASRAVGNVREIEENGLMLGMFPEAAYSSVEIRVGPEIAVCSTRTASSKPTTPRRRNSAGHVAGNSWKLIVTFLPLASLTPSSTTSPVFRATTPPARRRTTLPSSSSTFSSTLRSPLFGSPPVHPQFILDALLQRPEREKVHTVVGHRRLLCKPSSRTTIANGCGGSWQSS